MKPKLLILPSWYISEEDRINGSFFQTQGRLMSEEFETRVVFLNAAPRPSFRKIFSDPPAALRDWIGFIGMRDRRVELPDEEVFNVPELFCFEAGHPLTSTRRYQEWRVSKWTSLVEGMIAGGWRPNLIRAHTGFPAGVVARRIKERLGIPYILSEHLPFSIYGYESSWRSEIKAAFDEADRVLSLSYDKVRQLAMSDIDVEPHVIFNVVDEECFTGLARSYVPQQPLRLVTIGAASFYKDHKTLLRAVRAALDRGVRLHLTMIGLKLWGGDRLAETLGLIEQLNLQDNVTVIEKMSRAEVAKRLPDFHLFLMTSIQEGFPNAVLEALASGLFVVATRHGGTEDLIDDDLGVLVPVRNVERISDAIAGIYEGNIRFDPAQIRRKIIRECGRESYKRRVLDHYQHVIGPR